MEKTDFVPLLIQGQKAQYASLSSRDYSDENVVVSRRFNRMVIIPWSTRELVVPGLS